MSPCPAAGGCGGGREQLRVPKRKKKSSYKLKRMIGIKDGSAVRVQVLAPVRRAFGAAAWDPRCPRPTRGAVTGGVRRAPGGGAGPGEGGGSSTGGPDPQHRQPGGEGWD